MYKVIHFFTDLQDKGHPYHVGDTFPREGIEVSEERLMELSGSQNKQGKPLIELSIVESAYTRTEISRMSKQDLVVVANSVGIPVEDKTGAELKEELIEYFGL